MRISSLSRAIGIISVLGLSTVACTDEITDDDVPSSVDDPNGHDAFEHGDEVGLPESVEEDDAFAMTAPLAVGSYARVCDTEGLGLRQRTGPGTDQEVVRGLPEGALVKITAVGNGWLENTWDGLSGWSSGAYLCATDVDDVPVPDSSVVINGWTRPLANYRLTQLFRGASVHNGTDLAKAYGSIVYAAHAGRVVEIIKGYCRRGYACKGTGKNWAMDPKYHMSGDKIVVLHSDGKKTVYDHVSPSGLSWVGRYVYPDSQIGRINRTGNRTGAHLHFAVIRGGVAVNPEIYVNL